MDLLPAQSQRTLTPCSHQIFARQKQSLCSCIRAEKLQHEANHTWMGRGGAGISHAILLAQSS